MAGGSAQGRTSGRVRFGVISDIHPDMLPDGLERVHAFVAAMEAARVDFILQLGDFCWPAPSNRPYLQAWNAYRGPAYHVLGNHDMDDGHTREQTVAFCGMPGLHYTFTAGPVRGLVLDGNEPGGKASGYRRFIGPEQLTWLERELNQGDRPSLLFIHQPFDADHPDCLENSAAVRGVVERAEETHPGSVVAVFSGHLHLDFERGELVIEGRRTEWVGPDPWVRGETTDRPREHLHPWISDRRLKLGERAVGPLGR
jgi:3',5'-cyclic AMP phosphodiesterase CpdA